MLTKQIREDSLKRWYRRLRLVFCCTKAASDHLEVLVCRITDTQEIANYCHAIFGGGIDVVTSDTVAALALVNAHQQSLRKEPNCPICLLLLVFSMEF